MTPRNDEAAGLASTPDRPSQHNTHPAPDYGLVVDGSRPAVAVVAALPQGWTTASERLVLFALACDAFGFVSTPGYDALAQWTGLPRSSAIAAVNALLEPRGARPALLRKVDRNGAPIAPGKRGGRERTRFELLPQPSGNPDGWKAQQSEDPDGWQQSEDPDCSSSQQSGNPDGNSPGIQTVATLNSPATVQQQSGNPDPPFPSLTNSSHHVTTDARAERFADLRAAIREGKAKRMAG